MPSRKSAHPRVENEPTRRTFLTKVGLGIAAPLAFVQPPLRSDELATSFDPERAWAVDAHPNPAESERAGATLGGVKLAGVALSS